MVSWKLVILAFILAIVIVAVEGITVTTIDIVTVTVGDLPYEVGIGSTTGTFYLR
jgi:hypothetical protein